MPLSGERKINQMIKNQKNRYTMYEAVTAYLENNSSKYSDNAEFTDHFSSYRAAVTEIALTEDQRSKAVTGKTKSKNILREQVTEQALAVAGAVYSFAKKSGNVSLLESTDQNKSKLDRFRDTVLVIELNFIKDKALENSQAMEGYGFTAQKLSEFADNINAYANAVGAKAAGGAAKSGASKSLVTLFKDASDILDSIDRLMEIYRGSDEEFYQGYKSARVVKDLGIRHKEQDTITNAGQNQPENSGIIQPEKF